MRLAIEQKHRRAAALLGNFADHFDRELLTSLNAPAEERAAQLDTVRQHTDTLRRSLSEIDDPAAAELATLADAFTPHCVWIVGGDGWAYDIGFGGLDHVLASGRNVNILVLDTEVYSNTGGQASKATPRAAVAKFASDGKAIGKKDLGMLAMAYGNVYVAQVAIGANPKQTVDAFREAQSYAGPSLLIAYCQCIAHGGDMTLGMARQKDAVKCGYWPLYRFDPRHAHTGEHPLRMDSRHPSMPFGDFASQEARFAMLARAKPKRAEKLFALAQKDIDERWHLYEQMAGLERTVPDQEVNT